MRRFGPALIVVLLLAVGFFAWRGSFPDAFSRGRISGARSVSPRQNSTLKERQGNAAVALDPDHVREAVLQRFAYAQNWEKPQPAAMTAFREWTERYRSATSAERAGLEAEGVALARARRPEMLRLIQDDPQRALAVTAPAMMRRILPAAVLDQLEVRVAGRGDFAVVAGTPAPGQEGTAPLRRRIAFIDRVTYTVHSYGRREAQLAKEGASLHGVALEGHLALHESPLRALEPGEVPDGAVLDAHCPVSQRAVASLESGGAANLTGLTVAEAFGRTWEFCDATADMLERFEAQLAAAEEGTDPRVSMPGVTPPVAADAATSHTVGSQRVLVIRVDFSDLAGAPIAASDAQSTMDTAVKPYLETASYGATTLVTSVSNTVYRLPQTASAYATTGNDLQLHADARAAAVATTHSPTSTA